METLYFRNLQKRVVDKAISLFGDKNAGGIVLMKSFKDYYYGYESIDGKTNARICGFNGRLEMRSSHCQTRRLLESRIKRFFIALFGTILRMRNLLVSFDEFKAQELITERDLQDYLGRYQDLRDEWKNEKLEKVLILSMILYLEIELIKQIEINIDYILITCERNTTIPL